jgi:hypothetical protein
MNTAAIIGSTIFVYIALVCLLVFWRGDVHDKRRFEQERKRLKQEWESLRKQIRK